MQKDNENFTMDAQTMRTYLISKISKDTDNMLLIKENLKKEISTSKDAEIIGMGSRIGPTDCAASANLALGALTLKAH